MYRPQPAKDYTPHAIATLVLYYLGFGLVGLVCNLVFLSQANADLRTAGDVQGRGCLVALLVWHLALGALIVVAVVAMLALGVGVAALSPH